MKQLILTFRIVKIGKRAVSVAVCALTGAVMMGAGGGALAMDVNSGNSGLSVGDTSGDPALRFTGNSVNLSATVNANATLTGTGTGPAPAAVTDATTSTSGPSTTSLTLSGNNQVNGSISATYTTISSGGKVDTDPSPTINYVIGTGATVTGAVSSNVTVTGETATTLEGGVNGSLALTGSTNYFSPTVTIGKSGNSASSSLASITTDSDARGSVSFVGDGAVTVGAIGSRLGSLTVSDAGSLSTNGSVNIASVTANGSGTLDFTAADSLNSNRAYANIDSLAINGSSLVRLQGGLTGNVNFGYGATGTAELALNKNLVGVVSGNASGTLDLKGYNNVYGAVSGLALVKAARNVDFWSAVSAVETQVTGQSVTFHSTLNTDLRYTAAGSAYLYEGLTGSVNFNGQNASLTLADGKSIFGGVDTSLNNSGTLIFEGAGVVSGQVGAEGSLKEIQLNSTGTVSFLAPTVVRTSVINFNAAGTLNLAGGVDASNSNSGRIDFNNYAGTVNIGNGGSITGNVLSTGGSNGAIASTDNSLNFLGSGTMSGQVGGGVNQRIAQLNVGLDAPEGASGDVVTIDGDVYVGRATVHNDSTLQMADGRNLTGVVTTSANGTGSLTLLGGTQTVSDTVGSSEMALKAVNAGAEGATSNFASTTAVYADGLNVTGTGTVNLSGGFSGKTVQFQEDGTINLAAGKNIVGNIDAAEGGIGTLNLAGSNNVDGTIANLALVKAAANVDFQKSVSAVETQVGGANVTFHDTLATALRYTTTGSAYLQGDMSGSVDFNGQDATLTLAAGKTITGTLDTPAASTGTLIFEGAGHVTGQVGATAALKEIQLNGNGAVTFDSSAAVHSALVSFNADAVLNVAGGVDTRSNDSSGRIDFNNHVGSVNVGDGGSINGDVVSTGGSNGATASTSNRLNFLGSGSMSGQVGTSADNRIAQLNVGLDAPEGPVGHLVTIDGDVYASGVVIHNDSTLQMADGRNLTGDIATSANGTGTLTLLGGTQTVSGSVGSDPSADPAGMALKTVNAGAEGATSNFTNTAPIYATTFNVTGTGTVNLDGGLRGQTLQFQDDGTVNLAAGKAIIANIDAASDGTGTLNVLGVNGENFDQGVQGNIGATHALKTINAGAEGSFAYFDGNVNAQTLNVNGEGAAIVTGNLTGNVVFHGDGVMAMVSNLEGEPIGSNLLTGSVSNATGTNNSGILYLIGATERVTGTIGADGAALKGVIAGIDGSTTTLDGMVHAQTLEYQGNGTVVLNGTNGGAAAGGLIGNVDFTQNGTGQLRIGDGVKLTTGSGGITFDNANKATLTFDGSSTVSGVLGGNTEGRSTFQTVNAGAEGSVVTFLNDVYVGEAPVPTTFHVTGRGTVNFDGNLNGQLVFNSGANGVVNVADGKALIVTSAIPAVRSLSAGEGSVNFLGSTATYGDLGEAGSFLKAIRFNSSEGLGGSATLAHNLYARDIVVSANTAATYTDNLAFGGRLALAAASSSLDLGANTITGASDNSSFTLGSGTLKTSLTGARDGDGSLHVSGFGNISATSFSNNADARVVVNMPAGNWVMKDGDRFKLVDAGGENSGAHTLLNGHVTTNSAVISYTALSGNNDGSLLNSSSEVGDEDLWLIAHRVEGNYASLSNVANTQPGGAAGQRLTDIANGIIGASTVTTSDMRHVVSTFDSYSVGQMRPEVKRLAPIANASLEQSGFAAASGTLNTLSSRLAILRGDSPAAGASSGVSTGDEPASHGFWLKGFGSWGNQNARGGFDGYKTSTGGMVIGADAEFGQTIAGLAFSYANSKVDQEDSRSGDSARINSYQLTAYATRDYGSFYTDGMLAYGQHKFDSTRATALGRHAKGNFEGQQTSAKLGGGYRIALDGKTLLTPLAALEWTRLSQDGYTETGANALNLVVDSKTTQRTRSSLGARLSGETDGNGNGSVYRPEVHALWHHDFGSQNVDTTAAYAGGGAAFTTAGQTVARDSLNLGGGVTVLTGKTTSVQVLYDLEVRSGFTSHTGQLTGRWAF